MVSFSGQAQGTIALQCPEVGVTPCGYPFPWQAQGPAPTTAIVLNCPYVGKTPRGYPFSGQAQRPAPTTSMQGFSGRTQGSAPTTPNFSYVGVTPCGYPFSGQAQPQLPRCTGKSPWLTIFRAGTGVRPSAPITRFEGRHRVCPYDPNYLQLPGCITRLHDRKPPSARQAHSLL